jgi:putative modified peptide
LWTPTTAASLAETPDCVLVRRGESGALVCAGKTPRKNRRGGGVLFDVPVNPHGDERLVRLLRLLRPVPDGWVTKAQRVPFDMSVRDQPVMEERWLTDGDLAKLERELEIDPIFRQRFDADPVAAAEAAGMGELALGLEREMRELVALAERIANDDAYRAELDTDPLAALAAAGMPAGTAEPLLQALAVPDEVLAKLPEVVAHQYEQPPLKTRLLILLLGSSAVAEKIRSATPGA